MKILRRGYSATFNFSLDTISSGSRTTGLTSDVNYDAFEFGSEMMIFFNSGQVGITLVSTSLSPCSLFVIIANLRFSLHCIEMAVNPQWWSRSSTGHRDFTFWENSSNHTEGTWCRDDECVDYRIFEHGDGNG